MELINIIVEALRDPKRGPKIILSTLAFWFFCIALMQGINADLWSQDPQLQDVPATYEEVK